MRSCVRECGRHQAIEAARALAAEPITRVYASTALRARQTAALLATGPAIDVQVMPELVEAGVGKHEGTADPVVRKRAQRPPGETVAVVGHVASLTVALGRLCALGVRIWGTPLPLAEPFLVEWDGQAWHCPAWPGVPC